MQKRAKFGVGIGVIVISLAFLAWMGYGNEPLTQWRPVAAGLALAVSIVFCDSLCSISL